jgi:GNAT superfamily N-acetyltransferase
LLSLWRDHLANTPGADAEDTAAIVTWPSRDTGGIATLLRRGFSPLEVIAARTTPRRPARTATASQGRADARMEPANNGNDVPRIRRAGPADIDAVVRLGLEVIRFDAQFGAVHERPDTVDALRLEAAGLLAGPAAWTWLAERDGEAIGMLSAQRPESANWIAPMVRLTPAAYLMLMFVQPGERGSGVGSALVDRFHRETGTAGVAVTLLHYEQLNPLSAPFWNSNGYRPLWTSWQATPARAAGAAR